MDEIDFGTNNIKFSQNAKGIWLCAGFTVYADSIFDAIAIAKEAMEQIDKILNKMNKGKGEKE
jgi:hypothetical protein